MRKLILAAIVALWPIVALAAFGVFQVNSASNAIVFTHIPIGGAGAAIGISSVPSANLLIARTDQYNCYLSINGSMWTPLLTATNVPTPGALDATGFPIGNGCDEGVAAPSDPTNIWIGANGNVFVSLNQGSTFSATCYPAQSYGDGFSPSQTPGGTKVFNHIIAIDPANPSIVYMSTPAAGLSTTFDKGATCYTLAAVGTGGAVSGSNITGGGHLTAFDSSGGTTATCPHSATICTKNVYVSTYGTGVYKSTDGGLNWVLTTSTPTTHVAMKADPFGNLWFVDHAYGSGLGTPRKYNGTSWSTPAGLPVYGVGVAIDPNACASAITCKIVFMIGGGIGATGTVITTDGGANWNYATTITTAAGDVPWLANFMATFGHFPTGIAFDNSSNVYTGGEGIFRIVPPTAGSAVTWTPFTLGIEESLSSSVVTSPNTSGKVLLATWDLNCFVNLAMPYVSLPTDANRGCYGTNGLGLQHTYNADWSSSDPSFFVALTDNQQGYGGGTYTNFSGKSTDGGITWSALSAPPAVSAGPYQAGCIAAASPTNYVWAPTDGSGGNVAPFYTTDGGTNWTQISTSATQGWPFRSYNASKMCAADRVTANKFYLYNWNDGISGDAIYVCTSGGASCSVASRPGFGPNQQYFGVIKSVPGNAGHLFLSYASAVPSTSSGGALVFYDDAGVTPQVVANMKGVTAFGLGAAKGPSTYPSIVVNGWYNGVYGIWQSTNWDTGKTWTQIGTYPKNLGVTIMDIDGDKVIPDVFYYTTNSGLFCSARSTAYCNGAT